MELKKDCLNIIVAHTSETRAIGYENDLPWKRSLQGDLKWFNYITTQFPTGCIMGRQTFESLPKPLSFRTNIVITSNNQYAANWNEKIRKGNEKNHTCVFFTSFDQAIEFCKSNDLFICVIGGTNIYKQALSYPYRIFSTIIQRNDFKADRFFPFVDIEFEDVSNQIEKILLSKNFKKTWEFHDGVFYENQIGYKYFFGESM